MAVPIPDLRKKVLQAMARDCDVGKLQDEIKIHERNISNFQEAIAREEQTIAEYEYMIVVREAADGSPG